ncbi:hypothetical protein COOONC_18777 [Cooperia oncophora]
MLLALTILCIFFMNVYGDYCVPDYYQERLYSNFHYNLNKNLVWDEDLSERACKEAIGELGSHGFDKLTAEKFVSARYYVHPHVLFNNRCLRTFSTSPVRSSKIRSTLFNAFKNEAQVNVVRNLPAGTKYGCNAVESERKRRLSVLYEKQ